MKAPIPLLEELRGIHLPPEPSLWPPAPGWWILALLSAWVLWRALAMARRAWPRVRRRRSALAALAGIHARAHREPDALLCADIAVLLRRAALSRFPADEVAALTGDRWLEFLERTSDGEAAFTRARHALLEAPYRRGAQADVDALVQLCRSWILKVL